MQSGLTCLMRVAVVVVSQLSPQLLQVWHTRSSKCACTLGAREQHNGKELGSLLRLCAAPPDIIQQWVLHVPHTLSFGQGYNSKACM